MMKDQDSKQRTDEERAEGDQPAKDRSGRARDRSRSGKTERSVNMDELRELIALLRDNGLSALELEREGFRVCLRRGVEFEGPENLTGNATSTAQVNGATAAASESSATATLPTSSHPAATAKSSDAEDQDLHIIKSPIVGTFYRARSPNSPPCVEVGSRVDKDTVVCIIEAMKLMNEIPAETVGTVTGIFVENGQPVEYGQPLFSIRT